MVLGEAVAFSAAGAHALFGYNRENFLYDREQRQEFEFKVLEWRNAQAKLWREDLHDVIGLTEKKMDTYLIVNTLQLGMCVGLFAEGRLEPGTPPWLLHLYMLTLGAAFMYLLMSVWLAMHASVVATCSSARLLTQFVRLPVPTWRQLEEMRTYAQSFERLKAGSILRVPFTGKRVPVQRAAEGNPNCQAAGGGSAGQAAGAKADPWHLEDHGSVRELYELQEHPAALRRHIRLAQRAAKHYQCFDAFARVAMSFGTNQFLNAISYYALGYMAVQDGAPVPACCVVVIMIGIALGLVQVDFSLTMKEQLLARMFIIGGPMISAATVFYWTLRGRNSDAVVMALLPAAYACQGLWLLFALMTCGLRLLPNGSILPMRFRAVLYLDVFSWLSKQQDDEKEHELQAGAKLPIPGGEASPAEGPSGPRTDARVQARPAAPPGGTEGGKRPLNEEGEEPWGSGANPTTTKPQLRPAAPGPSGEFHEAPEHAFQAASYAHRKLVDEEDEGGTEIVTGHDTMHPGRLPAKVFRTATLLLIVLWGFGLAMPFACRDLTTKPLTADLFVEEITQGSRGDLDAPKERHVHTPAQVHPRKAQSLVLPVSKGGQGVPVLSASEIIQVEWPSHSGFVPHSLSCDPTGTLLVVADDLGVYSGQLSWTAKTENSSFAEDLVTDARTLAETPKAPGITAPSHLGLAQPALSMTFEHLPPCTALEGQAVKDISVVCSGDGLDESCSVAVLPAQGRHVAQCLLPPGEGSASSDPGEALRSLRTWTIDDNWLHDREQQEQEEVESFAINSQCLDSTHTAPLGQVGCVVVGTTFGRIVQLRGAYGNRSRLVPERAMQEREKKVRSGSLHVLPSGRVVALRHSSGTVEVFDTKLGKRVGQWQLPKGINWTMICGGGDSLFALGLRNRRKMELHRFSLPAELQVGLEPLTQTPGLQGRVHEI